MATGLGRDASEYATSLSNLATMLQDGGDPEGAEAFFREALAMRERLFPGDHADVAMAPDCLRELVRVLACDPRTALVGASLAPRTPLLEERLHWWLLDRLWWLEGELLGTAHVAAPCYALRPEVVRGPLPPDVMADDVCLALAVGARGFRVRRCARARAEELRVPRSWSELLSRHPAASVFHSPGWLRALRRTYGYEPIVATTSTESTLGNGIVLCRVNGWRSNRLVSLPFSDHCEPLASETAELSELLSSLVSQVSAAGASLELRPREGTGHSFASVARDHELWPGSEYCLHRIDLTADLSEIFNRFHPSSTRRAIRRCA